MFINYSFDLTEDRRYSSTSFLATKKSRTGESRKSKEETFIEPDHEESDVKAPVPVYESRLQELQPEQEDSNDQKPSQSVDEPEEEHSEKGEEEQQQPPQTETEQHPEEGESKEEQQPPQTEEEPPSEPKERIDEYLEITVISAVVNRKQDIGHGNPYVVVKFNSEEKRTEAQKDTENPEWNASMKNIYFVFILFFHFFFFF
jgi:hypothetical protein